MEKRRKKEVKRKEKQKEHFYSESEIKGEIAWPYIKVWKLEKTLMGYLEIKNIKGKTSSHLSDEIV